MSFRFSHPHLPRSARRAFLLLALVVAGWVAFVLWWGSGEEVSQPYRFSEGERQEMAAFEQSLRRDSLRRAVKYRRPPAQKVETFPFDPNVADSATLLRLGLRPFQVHNLLQYRRHGGVWRSVAHFGRLYGLDSATFHRLSPYVRIAPEVQAVRREAVEEPRRIYPEKYAPGTKVDANAADTTMFMGIPGIGSYYAGKIVRYRERLGGFVRVEQLSEIEGLPADITTWCSVEGPCNVRRIDVNQADFKTLVRHPYLDYEQVKEIVNYRDGFGPLRAWRDIMLSPHFANADTLRLLPYFFFGE